jgi:hypothetical protein
MEVKKYLDTEDEEYEFINIFGRGIWEETQPGKKFH